MRPFPKGRKPNAAGLETLEKLRPDLEAGLSDTEIGRKHGVSDSIAEYWRRYLRLPSAKSERTATRAKNPADLGADVSVVQGQKKLKGEKTLALLLPDLQAGLNNHEIARKHGVSVSTSKHWRRYLRLPSARTGRRVRLASLPEMERKLAAAIQLRDKIDGRVKALAAAIATMKQSEQKEEG